jgi:hypothetical protein
MGLFSRLTGRSSAPEKLTVDAILVEGDGNSVEVVGESNYLPALKEITGRRGTEQVRHPVTAALIREPDNPYDTHAVAVWVDGKRVGYLSRSDALEYQEPLVVLGRTGNVLACHARICGREGTSNLGVWLDLPEPDSVLDEIT